MHANELHVYAHHLKYSTKSAVARTCPLLADTEDLVKQRGAASDYIVSKALPRSYLAIEAIAEEVGLKRHYNYEIKGQDLKFHFSAERRERLKNTAKLTEDEIGRIARRAHGYGRGGKAMFINWYNAIQEEIKSDAPDTGDRRDRKVVLRVTASPRFRLPQNKAPCVMIAAGTGLAPFRSFWQRE